MNEDFAPFELAVKLREKGFDCPCYWEVIPETVGQFTGLLDKNGKEIMEVYEDYHTIIEFIEKRVIPKPHPQSKFKEYFNDKIHYYKLLIG